jgi:hypothetical protein
MMLHHYFKNTVYTVTPVLIGLASLCTPLYGEVTSLNYFDPFKVYSAIDPQDYLLSRKRLELEGASWWNETGQWCKISISGFFQSACDGKPMDGGDIPVTSIVDGVQSTTNSIGFAYEPILDLSGRTPMIPLVMGTKPANASYGPILTEAAEVLFPDSDPVIPVENQEEVIDPASKWGFFSLPSKYQKRGARMDLLINLCSGTGLHIKGSFASICHTPKIPKNLTCEPTDCPFNPPIADFPQVTTVNVNDYLMNEYDCIIKEIGMTNQTFQKTGLEEIVAELYWRQAFEFNGNREGWPHILVIPYFEGGFAFSPTNARNTNDLFSVGFGNNEHLAAGFAAGICIDFVETIELSGEIGYTHFFDHNFDCYRMPNSKLQNNIYPFNTAVNVQPGHNIYYAARLSARNFLERLSGYFQFVALEHAQDCIKVLNDPEHAFVPEVLVKKSGFKVKLANIGFTYPLTPNLIAGFEWQAPLSQRNCPRTTTIMFSLTGSF